jgi:hypothetical protein
VKLLMVLISPNKSCGCLDTGDLFSHFALQVTLLMEQTCPLFRLRSFGSSYGSLIGNFGVL